MSTIHSAIPDAVGGELPADADRAARSRPVTVPAQPAEDGRADSGLDQVLDRQLVSGALQHLSPAHRRHSLPDVCHGPLVLYP
jgi:hypothetical protein